MDYTAVLWVCSTVYMYIYICIYIDGHVIDGHKARHSAKGYMYIYIYIYIIF
jgi:hypothetical protein